MTPEQLTFALAIGGYAGLTATAVLVAAGRWPRRFWPLAALVIAAHVLLVWAVRYEWQFGAATRNGYAGFAIFHSALALILASLFAPPVWAQRFALAAFFVVTAGALGAVFRYDEVAIYRLPVIVLATVGIAAIVIVSGRPRRRG